VAFSRKKFSGPSMNRGPGIAGAPITCIFEFTLESLVFLDFEFSIDHIIFIRLG
jgi:hypothetical protein